MSIFFTADTHFGHANIIRFSGRPFASVDEMDEAMIDAINERVASYDTLYHLGDWAWRYPEAYRRRIACKHVHLILGNHDKHVRRLAPLFSSVDHLADLKFDGQPITLCHYAMKVWNKSHHGAWHLYGHSHGSLPDDPHSLSFDCGVDCWGYRPISLEEVATRMETKAWQPVDHHGHERQPRLPAGS